MSIINFLIVRVEMGQLGLVEVETWWEVVIGQSIKYRIKQKPQTMPLSVCYYSP